MDAPYCTVSGTFEPKLSPAQHLAYDAGYILWPSKYLEYSGTKATNTKGKAPGPEERFAAGMHSIAKRIQMPEGHFGCWQWGGSKRAWKPLIILYQNEMHPAVFMALAGRLGMPTSNMRAQQRCGYKLCVNPRHMVWENVPHGMNMPKNMLDLNRLAGYKWPMERLWSLQENELWDTFSGEHYWNWGPEYEPWSGKPRNPNAEPETKAKLKTYYDVLQVDEPVEHGEFTEQHIQAMGAEAFMSHMHFAKPGEQRAHQPTSHELFQGGELPTADEIVRGVKIKGL